MSPIRLRTEARVRRSHALRVCGDDQAAVTACRAPDAVNAFSTGVVTPAKLAAMIPSFHLAKEVPCEHDQIPSEAETHGPGT
jgi:hypothetical protein